ncbi:polysaccharide pyruvyl transferase family protein [Empedobacter stercoris]|uniref:polysaccharide pyruvyl transferase family protein n=1 Tax=Empedobacter stercoris TaxID=1628248 RepID=UPI001CE1064A|nr:polysaccharide pyruvyl transferase family protein [Empedobacter stercoris]MCA4777336.1 polysaccharide pyruvyl transferase family protein [Empedobacter stercoris]
MGIFQKIILQIKLLTIKIFCKKNKILVIPPTIMDGSFGDELMLITFLEKYKTKKVVIYEQENLIRKDLYDRYDNLEFLKWDENLILKNISHAYVLGADNMTGAYGEKNPLFKIRFLNRCNKSGVKTFILGFSLNENVNFKIKEGLNIISKKTKLYFREEDSYNRALKFIDNKSNVKLVADLAFLSPMYKHNDNIFNEWINNQKKGKRKILALCPNALQAKKIGEEKYVLDLISLLKHSIEKHNISILLLYHDLREHCNGKSDRDISLDIYRRLSCDYKENLFFYPEIKNGLEMKSYLQNVDFTLTGRMHFGISGYSLNKPMLGIAYEGKFSGLQKIFGIDPTKTLINDLFNISRNEEKIDYFIQNLSELKSKVELNIDKVKVLSKSNF